MNCPICNNTQPFFNNTSKSKYVSYEYCDLCKILFTKISFTPITKLFKNYNRFYIYHYNNQKLYNFTLDCDENYNTIYNVFISNENDEKYYLLNRTGPNNVWNDIPLKFETQDKSNILDKLINYSNIT